MLNGPTHRRLHYTTAATDDTILCNGSSPQTITLTADGITAGKTYTVTVRITSKGPVTVVSQNGEEIEGDDEGAIL